MSTVAAGAAPSGVRPSRVLPLGLVPVLLAGLPFVIAASAVLVADRTIDLVGDQALIGLDTGDAAGLRQLLGPYSRYGWTHPGPIWFYLLAPPYVLLGRSGAALAAAVLFGQALAGAVVVCSVAGRPAGRRSGLRPAWGMSLAALAVAVYLVRVPAESLIALWNPAVLALPMAALIVLAARAATGSLPGVAGAALAGTFLVQTHLGTVPVVAGVAAVLAVVVAVRPAAWVRGGRRAPPPFRTEGRQGAIVAVAASVLTVLAWVPPLVQQLRGGESGGPGNITLLVDFFTAPAAAGFTWTQGLGTVIRLVAVPITGATPQAEWLGQPLSGRLLVAVVAFVLGCVALVVAGLVTGARQGAWTGALTLVALLAAAQAVTGVRGPVFTYLVEWSYALPLTLAVGWCDVAAHKLVHQPPAVIRQSVTDHEPARPERALAVGVWGVIVVTAVTAALAAVGGVRMVRVPILSDSPGVERLTTVLGPVVSADLPARPGPDLVLDIQGDARGDGSPVDDWPIAAGIALWLREQAHREVVVPQRWEALFGADHGFAASGTDAALDDLPVLTVVTYGAPPPDGARLVATDETERGPVELWLTTADVP